MGKLQLVTNNLDISEPQLPHYRRRCETGSAEWEFAVSPKAHYRQIYYEVDLIVSCIRNRFDQPGYQVYHNLQELLLKADYEEYAFVTKFYGNDFDLVALKTQLTLYSTLFAENKIIEPAVQDALNFTCMRSLSLAQKSLLGEVYTLTKLVIVMSATNAISEHSFSS